MKIQTLKNHLNDMLLTSSTPIPTCGLDSGLHFLYPVPSISMEHMVYAGTLTDWKLLQQKSSLKSGCTYLICSPSHSAAPDFDFPSDCNVLLLSCTLSQLTSSLCNLPKEQEDTSSALEEKYASFWEKVKNHRFASHTDALEKLQQFSFPLAKYISCLLVRTDALSGRMPHPENITRLLRKHFPHTNVFHWENEWIALLSFDDPAAFSSKLQTGTFESFLMQHRLTAAISHPTREFHTLQMLYFTADAALTLGLQMHFCSGSRLFTYTEYSPYYLIHLSYQELIRRTGQDNLLYLAHPDIVKLYLYDLENHSDLLQVLSTYLKYGHNLSQTASKLYMHRNTLLNRLNKIKKLCILNLEDTQNHFILQLSCMLVDYYCNFARRSV